MRTEFHFLPIMPNRKANNKGYVIFHTLNIVLTWNEKGKKNNNSNKKNPNFFLVSEMQSDFQRNKFPLQAEVLILWVLFKSTILLCFSMSCSDGTSCSHLYFLKITLQNLI